MPSPGPVPDGPDPLFMMKNVPNSLPGVSIIYHIRILIRPIIFKNPVPDLFSIVISGSILDCSGGQERPAKLLILIGKTPHKNSEGLTKIEEVITSSIVTKHSSLIKSSV